VAPSDASEKGGTLGRTAGRRAAPASALDLFHIDAFRLAWAPTPFGIRSKTVNLPRRKFLHLAAGAAALPAMAQEKAERPNLGQERGSLSVAETLARYAFDLKYEHLPDEVVRTAKRTILDTIGCAIGGYSAGPSQIAVKLAGTIS